MMKTLCAALCCAASFAFVAGAASAGGDLYNNWNSAGCGFTDHAGFPLHRPARLTSIELWYHWGPNESDVGYEVFHNGRSVKRGLLMRAGCDPYQEAWCGARDNVGVDLPPGDIEIRVDRGRVCQNHDSHGEGFIHAYGMPLHGGPMPPPPPDR